MKKPLSGRPAVEKTALSRAAGSSKTEKSGTSAGPADTAAIIYGMIDIY